MRMFRIHLPLLHRLPPRGKYRYSRNQLVREMCQRFQNSTMDLEI